MECALFYDNIDSYLISFITYFLVMKIKIKFKDNNIRKEKLMKTYAKYENGRD